MEKINRTLARLIGVLNAGLAIALVLLGLLLGISGASAFAGRPSFGDIVFGLLIGAMIGVAMAVAICGLLAILINIRDLLEELAQKRRADRGQG